jgi:hypothetical protein
LHVKTVGSVAIAVVLALAFVGFVAMHAVSSRVETEAYFADVLDSTEFYRRLYDEVLVDPEIAPIVDRLSGGVDIPRDQLIDTMKQLVDPAFLQEQTRAIIARLVAHFTDDKRIDLTFDITSIVRRVRAFALDTATKQLARLQYHRVASFDAFRLELERDVRQFKATGALPSSLPTFEYSPDEGERFVDLLVLEARLDPDVPAQAQVIADIRRGVAKGDVQQALQVAGPALLHTLIDQSLRELTNNDYVTTIDGPDGPHYIFGPSGDVHDKVERELGELRKLDHAATIGEIACTIAFVLCIVALVAIHRRSVRGVLGWLGGAFVGAGALGFFGWLVARGPIATKIDRVAASKKLPRSLQEIVHDVVSRGVAGFTRSIWIPSLAIAVLGAVLAIAALTWPRVGATTSAPS